MYDLLSNVAARRLGRQWSRHEGEEENQMSLHRRSARGTSIGMTAAAAGIALLVAGCTDSDPGGPSNSADPDSPYGFETAPQDATSPVTIWVDADRAKI